jgi:hypothetical protein
MKRILLLSLLFSLFATPLWAAPFLVCDYYAPATVQPTYFTVQFDGGAIINSIPQSDANGARLHYDVSALTKAAHSVLVAACNDGGCSVTVPFSFTLAVPGAPGGLKLNPT